LKFALYPLLLVTLTAGTLCADVLYNPTPLGSSARFSDYGSASSSGFRSLDNFTVAPGGTVEKVTWSGFWLDLAGQVPAPAPSPDVTSWEIAFYADNAGTPGTQLLLQSFPAADVTSIFNGFGVYNIGTAHNVAFYTYSVDLTSAFQAAAATQYWVAVLSRSTEYNPVFAVLGATGYDDASYQQQLGAGLAITSSGEVFRDRAITLEGTAVPEPGTLAIGATGVLLAPLLRRFVRRSR
jgi:hypothetical protein